MPISDVTNTGDYSVGSVSSSAEVGKSADQTARLVEQYNTEINTLFTEIAPNLRGIPPSLLQSLAQNLVGVQQALSSQTSEQLANTPGLLDGLRQLVNHLRAGEQQCLAQIQATGVADFSTAPLSQQLNGDEFAKIHSAIYNDAASVLALLNA